MSSREVYHGGTSWATYLRGMNLIRREIGGGQAWYHYNAHGDVAELTDGRGLSIRKYDYDAFGVEQDADPNDRNPFRYCGEYWEGRTETYYLRARTYAPATGRFLQRDPHWNTANMIYGDNPQAIHQRQDVLGLTHYTYTPQITAIMQSGNLYVYCMNNPVSYTDSTGDIAILTAILIGAAVGAIIGGTAGGIYGYNVAAELDVAEQDRWKYVVGYGAGGAIAGGVIGGLAGYGIGSVLGTAAGTGLATGAVGLGFAPVSQTTVKHIMAEKHAWELVVSKVNWANVQKIVQEVIRTGEARFINTTDAGGMIYEAVQTIYNQTVVVTYAIINGVIRISNAWVQTK